MLADEVRDGFDGVVHSDTTPGITAGYLKRAIKAGTEELGLDITKGTITFQNGTVLGFGDSARTIRLRFAEEVFGHPVSSFNELSPEELGVLRHFLEQPEHQRVVTEWLDKQYGHQSTLKEWGGSWS